MVGIPFRSNGGVDMRLSEDGKKKGCPLFHFQAALHVKPHG
jgi:hypothetical protein